MDDYLEDIKNGVTYTASAEAKHLAANACHAILALIEPEPDQALVTQQRPALTAFALDTTQILDLMISKLRAVVPKEDQSEPAGRPGFRIDLVPSIHAGSKDGAR